MNIETDFPYFLLIIGLFLVVGIGLFVVLKGFSKSVEDSQTDILTKLLLLLFEPLGFLLLTIGLMIIGFKENFLSAFEGLGFGIIAGLFAAFVAYKQSLPNWDILGFSRAKTQEEKKRSVEFQQKQLPEIEKYTKAPFFISYYGMYSAIIIVISIIFGQNFAENSKLFFGVAACFFVFFLLGGFSVLAILADKKVREKFEAKNNVRKI